MQSFLFSFLDSLLLHLLESRLFFGSFHQWYFPFFWLFLLYFNSTWTYIIYLFNQRSLTLPPESVRKPEVHTFILYIYYFYVCGFYILLYLSSLCIHLIYFSQFIPLFITYMATVGFLCNIKGLIQPPRGKAEGEILLAKLTKHHVNHYTYFFFLSNHFRSN